MRHARTFILLLCALVATGPTRGQEGISKRQQERNLAKKAREDEKARKRKAKEDRERHLSIQDKATRKRLERNFRHAERHGGGGGPRRGGKGLFFGRRKR